MIFLQRWLSTNRLANITPLKLVDMAYVVVLLPLVLMFKVPMVVFLLLVLTLLFFKKTKASNWLVLAVFILGIVAVYLSMYGEFSFRGLSRLKLFLELLVYVLLVVVSMQRLTREINFYLLISPFLFLALSLFFYHGIVMLSYVIFEVFFLLWMILSHRMGGKLVESFRTSMVMFMYSLPWVVLLFIFFPRISFEHASYGFKGETVKRMGHDGTMYLDGNALLVPSDRIVMEVGFDGEVPPMSSLYFRGSILYVDKKDHWEPLPTHVKRKNKVFLATEGKQIKYKVTLYPTQKRWLYMLDMPKHAIKDSQIDQDLITTVKKKLREPIHYEATSTLNSRYYDELDDITRKASTKYDVEQNPQTYKEAQVLKSKYVSKEKRAKAVMRYFKTQDLTYTLKPDALDTNHSTDSFLFDKRRGYCVHFASSFVTMARMAGIPARVVTGYKSDKSESLNNYLAVKEKDAHAWVELYINKYWTRFETTNTASNIDLGSMSLASAAQNKEEQNPLLKKINLYLMYAKYQVETWILYYSNVRQLQLLEYAKHNPKFVFGFILSFIGLVIVSFIIIAYFRRPRYSSEVLEAIQPIVKILNTKGYIRKENETLHQYFLRYSHENSEKSESITMINKIDHQYEELIYGNNISKLELKHFKTLVKKAVKLKAY